MPLSWKSTLSLFGGLALLVCSSAVQGAIQGAEKDASSLPDSEQSDDDSNALPQTQRRKLEMSMRRNPYAISPHRPNFMLPFSWSHRPSGEPFGLPNGELNHFEVKFQLSLKVAVWEDPFALPFDVYFAYTGRSFWQAYNDEKSSPFRDTNHEPEMFISSHGDWAIGPLRDLNIRLGFSHQSNGQPLPFSRSWNRVYLGANGRWKRFFVDAVIWDRIAEDPKTSADDPKGDDNPDIERFIGQGELVVGWVIGNKTVRVNWRNNLRADNHSALTAAFNYPLNDRLKGYVELFSGYGETLIDYNRTNERISFGIALSDWP